MAQLPEGTLMRRAAFGLARHARRMLGRTAGRRVGLLVGAGDNGGDALWAGVELRRRGAGVTAVLLDPARAHPAGLAAFRRAGGRTSRPGRRRARRAHRRRPRARRHRRDLAAGAGCATPRPAGRGGRAGRGADPRRRPAQRRRHRHRRGRRRGGHGHRDGHVRRPQARATSSRRHRCGPVHVVDIGLGPYLPDAARARARPPPTWPGAGRGPGRRTTSTARAWSGVAAGSDDLPRRRRARHGRGGAGHQRHGALRGLGARGGARPLARGGHRADRRGGRPHPGVGGRAGHRHRRRRAARCSPRARPRTCRWWSTPTASPCWPTTTSCARRVRGRPCSPRTPGSSRGSRARSAPTGSPPPAAPPPSWASPCCSRATPPSWPTRTGGALVHPRPAARGRRPRARATSSRASPARCSPPGWSRGGRPGARRSCTRGRPTSPPTAVPAPASRLQARIPAALRSPCGTAAASAG